MTRKLLVRLATLAVCGATLVGCRDSGAPPDTRATYTQDVAPILFAHCATCHRPGGVAPFSVLDFETVRIHGPQIVAAVESRRMPPWLPEPGYGAFAGERRLTDGQIETIRRWAAGGSPEGRADDLPPPPQFSGGWQLGEPDLIVKLPRPYVLEPGEEDVFRNFVIPIPIAAARYVSTVELRPGSARFVHHGLMAVDETRSSRRRDEQDEGLGFAGMDMGEAHMPEGTLLGWSPGMLPFPGTKGAAWRLEPRTDLVLQLHLMPSDKPQTIDPVVGFHFASGPGTAPPTSVLMLDADWALDIPAGDSHFVAADTMELPVDVQLLVVYPHAHYLGKSVEAWATLPDGSSRPLLRIPRWDFKWQDVYRFDSPVALPKGTALGMRWIYDNSTGHSHRNLPPGRVRAGNRTTDEMAHLQVQVGVRDHRDRLLLEEAYFRYLLGRDPTNARFLFGLGGALKDQGRWPEAEAAYRGALARRPEYVTAHNNLGAVLTEQRRTSEAIGHFQAAVRFEPEFAGAHYNLAFALGMEGQVDKAITGYREALRYNPDFGEAHANLGQLLGSKGNLDEAVRHLREAVRLMPASAEAVNSLGIGLWLAGQRDDALNQFRRALEIDPNHAGARRNLEAAAKEKPAPLR